MAGEEDLKAELERELVAERRDRHGRVGLEEPPRLVHLAVVTLGRLSTRARPDGAQLVEVDQHLLSRGVPLGRSRGRLDCRGGDRDEQQGSRTQRITPSSSACPRSRG